MAKGGNFGGLPQGEFEKIAKFFGPELQGAASDKAWIAQLEDKVKALHALALEEHAAANVSDEVDVVTVVMKSIDVRTAFRDVVGGAAVKDLTDALGDLEAAWEP